MTSDPEKKILDHLGIAWDEFLQFDDHHPDDIDEFRYALHTLQTLIAWRVARRADPETWGGTVKPSEPTPADEVADEPSNPDPRLTESPQKIVRGSFLDSLRLALSR